MSLNWNIFLEIFLRLLVKRYTTFRKLAVLPSSGGGIKPNLFGPFDEANLVQGLGLALSNGPYLLGFILPSDDGSRASFRNFNQVFGLRILDRN
jgi:hypothetical protein